MKNFLSHLFLPRPSNNHRAGLLKFKALFILILFFNLSPFASSYIKNISGKVLGDSVSIIPVQLLSVTNQDRRENGLNALADNSQLDEAAAKKAEDMFAKNYWAHNAPDGTTPWVFIKNAGYSYIYAGENLARGFNSSKDVVDAWMQSPEHRQNMLSSNFEDVGFAVMQGKLNGEQTTLVVEEFGGKTLVPVNGSGRENIITNQEQSLPEQSPGIFSQVLAVRNINISYSGKIVLFMMLLFMSALILDLIFSRKSGLVRVVGHNIDHLLLLILIVLLVIDLARGSIL